MCVVARSLVRVISTWFAEEENLHTAACSSIGEDGAHPPFLCLVVFLVRMDMLHGVFVSVKACLHCVSF